MGYISSLISLLGHCEYAVDTYTSACEQNIAVITARIFTNNTLFGITRLMSRPSGFRILAGPIYINLFRNVEMY